MSSVHHSPQLQPNRLMCAYDDANRYLDAMDRHFEEITDHGFNSVLLCVNETDLIERTASSPNTPHIVKMFALARDHGLYTGIDPWGVGKIFGGEAMSGLGKRTMYRNGQERDVVPAEPEAPETVDLMHLFLDTAEAAGADFVFYDEPDFRDGSSQAAELEFIDRWTGEAHGRGLATSVCVTAGKKLLTMAQAVAELHHVDEIATDPIYSGPDVLSNMPGTNNDSIEEFVGGRAKTVSEIAQDAGKQAAIWIQGHRINAGHERTIVHEGAIEAAKHVNNLGFFAFRAFETYSNIAPANPQLVWDIAGQTFRDLGTHDTRRDLSA